MTIDPMAAVTSVTDSVGSSALGAETAASPAASANAASSAASNPQAATQAPTAEQATKVDLFDYAAKQQNKPPAIDTLAPESKANYLSNPSALGEKVLQQMEKLHERSMDYHHQFSERSSTVTSTSAGDDVMAGPASQHVAGTAQPAESSPYTGLKLMFDYAVETTMISKTSSQFVSSVNTLIKGQ